MDSVKMLRAFCDAVEQRNGAAFAALFTEEGVYHDVFYGAFAGRAKIAEMIDDWFYRTATDFRWDMHTPVSDGQTLYARYTFSYRSLLPEAKGARAMFEGVAIMRLKDGRIAEYHEVANTATGFVDMNFAPERLAKIVARQGAALKARPEMKRHLLEGIVVLRRHRPPCAQLRTGADDPVRRDFSILSRRPLEYWMPRLRGA